MKIVFVKPPLFRLAGSHSNKVMVELSFWRAQAEAMGHSTEFFNGDFSSASQYWSWFQVMRNTDMLKSMIDLEDRNPVLHEIAEAVMSLKPDCVVVSSDDTFLPSVGLDSPFACAYLARIFRQKKVLTVGIGTFFNVDPELGKECHLVLEGGPNRTGIQIIEGHHATKELENWKEFRQFKCGVWDTGLQSSIRNPLPDPSLADYSYVATTKGCNFPCKFCYNTLVAKKFEERPIYHVRDDILRRVDLTGKRQYYITDQIFTRNLPRLKEMRDAFLQSPVKDCTFTVEARNELVLKGGSDMAKTMYGLGVRTAKMGIENTGDLFNKDMKKGQKKEDLKLATKIMRDQGIDVVAYLFVGGPTTDDEYKDTINFCKDVNFDGYVISMWSHPMADLGTDRYKYDAHFSLARRAEWNLPDWVLNEYEALYNSKRGNRNLSIFNL